MPQRLPLLPEADAVMHLKKPRSILRHAPTIEDLERRVAELEKLVENWQCTSGLIGSCGDPSSVRPEHLEKCIAEDERRIAALESQLALARETEHQLLERTEEIHRAQEDAEEKVVELEDERARKPWPLDSGLPEDWDRNTGRRFNDPG
jgi:hypothetical protein